MRLRFLLLALAASALAFAGSGQKQEEEEGREVKVAGCVLRGVEGGCVMLLTDDARKYNLIGDQRPAAGSYAEVTGTLRPGMPTICMEGVPLVVKQSRRLRDSCPAAPEK